MGTRRLSSQPLTSYDLEVQQYFSRLRLYSVVRPAPETDTIQQGTLYQAQLDSFKTIVENVYNESRLLIRLIRDTKGSFNPVLPIPDVQPPSLWKPTTWLPSPSLRRVKNSNYKGRGCQATISGSVGPHMNGGVLPLGPIKLIGPLPIKPRPPRPWPPFPPPPPPGPINVWIPAMEEVYSASYAHYQRFLQVYNAPPFDAYDFTVMSYFCLNHWQLVNQMYRYHYANEDAFRLRCNETARSLEDALC